MSQDNLTLVIDNICPQVGKSVILITGCSINVDLNNQC